MGSNPTPPRRIISPSSISPYYANFLITQPNYPFGITTVIQNGFARTMIANTLGATSEIVRPVEQTNRFAFKR